MMLISRGYGTAIRLHLRPLIASLLLVGLCTMCPTIQKHTRRNSPQLLVPTSQFEVLEIRAEEFLVARDSVPIKY